MGQLRDNVAAAIIEGIETGEYPAGQRLPYNSELETRYGASAGTISNALYDVQRAGYLEEKSRNARWTVKRYPGVDTTALAAVEQARQTLDSIETLLSNALELVTATRRQLDPIR